MSNIQQQDKKNNKRGVTMSKYRIKKRWITDILSVGTCLLFVFGINYCFKPILVNGQSMFPTYQNHDFLISSRVSYDKEKPQRGDVVIVDGANYGYEMFLIKRVVGIEGDTIEVKNNKLYVNGELQSENYIKEKMNTNYPKVKINKNQVFIMGDNRNDSIDSRYFGPVALESITGKIVLDSDWLRNLGHIMDLL